MKRTEYHITLYFHDEESHSAAWETFGILKELLPHADVEWESCKRDHSHVTITIEEPEVKAF